MTQKIDFTTKEQAKKIKKNYKHNNKVITINDLGQGSKTLSSTRSIAEIYKTASSKGSYAELLYQLVRYYTCKKVLELGTSLGIGTFYLAKGNKQATVTTIDASQETQTIAKAQLQELGLSTISYINSSFKDYFEQKPSTVFDLIFIDGHHNGQALIGYLQSLENNMHDETIIVIDDIRWSKDMFEAWNSLVLNQHYHLTLDLFRMGIIMKRQHQAKEHFKLKIKGILKGMI